MEDLRIEDATLANADHRASDDRADSTRPAPSAAYLEAHSALNGPLLACGLLAPAAAEIACLVLGVVLRQPWFFVTMGWFVVPIMIWTTLVYRNWPTGIRFDGSAISIGAIGSARAARRHPTVNHQSRGLFTCPWPAVQSQPRLSSTWVVPTRHAEALSRELQAVPGHQGPVRPG